MHAAKDASSSAGKDDQGGEIESKGERKRERERERERTSSVKRRDYRKLVANAKTCTILQCQAHKAATCPTKTEINAFTYDNQHYLQVCGTAMGTRMAPSYANIFMGVLEKNMLATPRAAPQGKTPLFYKRFIDDVFGIWLFGEEAQLAFVAHANKAHPSINFTCRFSTEVDFMDSPLSIRGDSISSIRLVHEAHRYSPVFAAFQ